MRMIGFLLAALLGLATGSPAPAAGDAAVWWEADWPYRKALTIDTTGSGINISGPVGRSLVLVRLHSGNFTFADALDNGADLRFVASDGKTPLAHHIERFDKANELALVWVSLPNVNGGEKQDIYLYYGNKSAPAGDDRTGSFDADDQLTFHFTDAPGQPATDATANANRAQNPPAGVNDNAIIARGARFSGKIGIVVPDHPSLAIAASGNLTFTVWIRPEQLPTDATILSRGTVTIGLAGGIPYVVTPAGRLNATQPLRPGEWSHLGLVANGSALRVYVNGVEVAAASTALPALSGAITLGASFTGEMDEIRLSRAARPASLMMLSSINQGANDKLVAFGADESQGAGHSPLLTIVQNTPFDAWVVIAVLIVMFVIAVAVMWTKVQFLGRAMKANRAFMVHYRRLHTLVPFSQIPDIAATDRKLIERAPLKHLYNLGLNELEHRRERHSLSGSLTAETLEAIRASVDAQMVHENERLDKWMVLLTIAISGGPFIGLLGTVLGVMLVFGEVAAAGDVNINAIAPGIAAALLATVAGLGVAIPALFGYNYLNSLIVSISNEMRVFVDRIITRLAEEAHHDNNARPVVAAAE